MANFNKLLLVAVITLAALSACGPAHKSSPTTPSPQPIVPSPVDSTVAMAARLTEFQTLLEAYRDCLQDERENCEVLAGRLNTFDFG